MKIVVLTPIFAITTTKDGVTPVVHYITREWVKMGHEVTIFHLPAKYPWFFYWIAKLFQHQLNTRFGSLVPTSIPKKGTEIIDGEIIIHLPLKKIKPHTSLSIRQQNKAINTIVEYCHENGKPDVIIGHWDNPQLDLLPQLKKILNVPIGIIFHSNYFNLEKRYEKDVKEMMSIFDFVGFRSLVGKECYEAKYGKLSNSIIVPSGVSDAFIKAGAENSKRFHHISNFTFIGSLIRRKYPLEVLKAVHAVYGKADFRMTFIGDGDERGKISEYALSKGIEKKVIFTGRIKREEIIEYLRDTDVFVMISESEIFGLVYLEAMAMGCITIGSKGEGIDGIIKDKENGFLCCSGDEKKLALIIDSIRDIPREELSRISNSARITANDYSDYGVAKNYIDIIRKIVRFPDDFFLSC